VAWRLSRNMCDQRANPDRLIADIAARQHGVVSVRQLRAAGLDKHRVRHRVRTGRLHPVHRGVYAVGHAGASPEAKWMAAVLTCGNGAVLSHVSAAALWKLLPDYRPGVVHISIPGDGGRQRRSNIRLHRSSTLGPTCMTRCHGIPVTTPARTVADLRRIVSAEQLRRAIRQAEILGLGTGLDVPREPTRSELEHRFLLLCRRYRIPTPAVNVRIGPLLVDFVWPGHRLIVETDGYRFHRGRIAFEEDRARDLQLRELGYNVVRLSYRQVVDHPKRVAAVLRKALLP
jgi:very-short-patch-repair endonuclease